MITYLSIKPPSGCLNPSLMLKQNVIPEPLRAWLMQNHEADEPGASIQLGIDPDAGIVVGISRMGRLSSIGR